MPKVSVVIPTYNCSEYIDKAVRSVLSQTYKDFEIIVVDDGSTDNTKELLQDYIDKGLIKYTYQKNKGLPGARNTGIDYANGQYIVFLDADDELHSSALEKCYECVSKDNSEWCITDILRIEDNKSEVLYSEIKDRHFIISVLDNCYRNIRRSFFFSKKALFDVDFFDVSQKIYEDWDLFIRLLEANKKFIYINEPLYIYKIRKRSLVKKNTTKNLFYISGILKKHHKRLADSGNKTIRKIYAKHMWNLARRYLYETSNFFNFIYCLKESLIYDFSFKTLTNPVLFRLRKLIKI